MVYTEIITEKTTSENRFIVLFFLGKRKKDYYGNLNPKKIRKTELSGK